MLPLLLALLTPARACEVPATRAQLADALARGEEAWAMLDRRAFDVAWADARTHLACLAEPVHPEEARSAHLVEAYACALERDDAAARAAFRSILAVDPTWQLPVAAAPPTHRLRLSFVAAQGDARDPRRPVHAPPGGTILVDGLPSGDVPLLRPVIVQALDAGGRVLASGLLEPGAPAPGDVAPYVAALRVEPSVVPLPEPPLPVQPDPRHPLAVPLLVGAAVSALAAGGLYAAASVQADRMAEGDVGCADLEATRGRVNGLVLGSGGAAVAAVGAGAAGVVLWRW